MTVLEHVIETSKKKRLATREKYLRAIRRFQDYGDTHGLPINGATVEAWRDSMAAEGVPPGTVNGRLAALKFAARRYEALGHGPDFARAAEFLPVVTEKRREARPFAEATQLLAVCRGRRPADLRDFAMFTLGFRTGLRRESIASLRFEDIDGRRFTAVIKGGRRHVVTVDDEVLAAFEPWLDWLRRHGITTGHVFRAIRRSVGRDGFEPGEGLHPTSINRIMAARCELAGVQFHPHLMRHCAISWLEAAGVPRSRIIALTGHVDERSLGPYLSDVEASSDPVGGHIPPLSAP